MAPRSTEIDVGNGGRVQNEDFLRREPIILLVIICITCSNGITIGVQQLWWKDIQPYSLWILSATVIPILGTTFFTFLSEVIGRKQILITLSTLSIISNVLHALPWDRIIDIAFPIQGLLTGGTKIMSAIAITEYAAPKHRFTYLFVNSTAFGTVYTYISILFTLVPSSYRYVLAFQLVLGVVCLVTIRKCPESPYWLASNGKFEDSKESFLWLRGQESKKELDLLLKERRSPWPLGLYWSTFFVALATIFVTIFTILYQRYWQRWLIFQSISEEDKWLVSIIGVCGFIVITLLISVASYFVKRKVLFVVVCGISILFSYGISIWLSFEKNNYEPSSRLFYFAFLIEQTIATYGPLLLGSVVCMEIIPVKYNSHMAGVHFLFKYIVNIPVFTFADFEISHSYIPIYTTLTLVCVIIYYCYAPETKGKTLLEIQKSYTPKLNETSPKEEPEVMTRM